MVETETGTAPEQILNMDDAVEELSPSEVKDAWARGQFMHQIIKARRPSFIRTQECEDIEDLLSNTSNAGIKDASIAALGWTHNVTESLGWEDGPGNVETLLSRLYADYEYDYDDEEDPEDLIAAFRGDIKKALRGTGMPRINVMRERVKKHSSDK